MGLNGGFSIIELEVSYITAYTVERGFNRAMCDRKRFQFLMVFQPFL